MRRILVQFVRRDAHPMVQFVKYGLCGGIATAVDVVVFFLLAWKFLPALTPDDPLVGLFHISGPFVTDVAVQTRHFVVDVILTFLVSNATAYILNVLWVFHPGRHARHMEMLLFAVVSITSVGIATVVATVLINYFGMTTTVSYAAKVVASVLINYAGRKFLVFKG